MEDFLGFSEYCYDSAEEVDGSLILLAHGDTRVATAASCLTELKANGCQKSL